MSFDSGTRTGLVPIPEVNADISIMRGSEVMEKLPNCPVCGAPVRLTGGQHQQIAPDDPVSRGLTTAPPSRRAALLSDGGFSSMVRTFEGRPPLAGVEL